ncbi:MAG: hypothetical protein ACRC9Q_05015 [Bacteroidales bacterium]
MIRKLYFLFLIVFCLFSLFIPVNAQQNQVASTVENTTEGVDEKEQEASPVINQPKPVLWERYFYPRENYEELIRLCARLNTPEQIGRILNQLTEVEPLLDEYNRPKGKYYMIRAQLLERLGDRAASFKSLRLANEHLDAQTDSLERVKERKQARIYELQSEILNKKKRTNILFFLFIGLAGAFFILTRDSKLQHMERKKRKQQEPDSIDEELIDKVQIAASIIIDKKSPNLTINEIVSLGFETRDDYLSSFQLVMGMTPKEYFEKYVQA